MVSRRRESDRRRSEADCRHILSVVTAQHFHHVRAHVGGERRSFQAFAERIDHPQSWLLTELGPEEVAVLSADPCLAIRTGYCSPAVRDQDLSSLIREARLGQPDRFVEASDEALRIRNK